ncbi:MAG: MOSC domain-containing protein [Flavobacteriales bacterium]|nr:MOSC domain-containing protein [Flavobacteriales bacterium]
MGKVIGIAGISRPTEDITVYASARVSFRFGVADDYRGKLDKEKQISILSEESWNEVCKDLGQKLHWTKTNANLLLQGFDLKSSIGKMITIGNFKIEITGDIIPSDEFNEVYVGLKEALSKNNRAGVYAKVIVEGVVSEGDYVRIIE